ncbi:hypothetical protein LDENG_00070930 [Lucifuga dentata]|nr:hypothetical protein LDENG_00070930 [Lucifuga dentata]
MVKMTKSKTFQAYLPTCHRTYSCIHCRAHLANHDELISKVQELFITSALIKSSLSFTYDPITTSGAQSVPIHVKKVAVANLPPASSDAIM